MKDEEHVFVPAHGHRQAGAEQQGEQPLGDGAQADGIFLPAAVQVQPPVADDVVLGRAHERGADAQVALDHGHRVVEAETDGHGQQQREPADQGQHPARRQGPRQQVEVGVKIDRGHPDQAEQGDAQPALVDPGRAEQGQQADAGQGEQEHGQEDRAVEQVGDRVQLGQRPQAARQHHRRQPPGVLGPALHPAELLRLDAVHLHRQLGRGLDLLQEDDPPVAQLGAEAQVQVLGEGVGPPAAGLVDGPPPPDAGRAVELEEVAARLAAGLLDGEMDVQLQGLQPGEQRVVVVQMGPAGLHHAHPLVLEIGHGGAQKVRVGQEVGIEDGHELAPGLAQSLGQGPGLVAGAVNAMEHADVQALLAVAGRGALADGGGFVGGVIQHLHLEPVARIAHAGDVVDQPLGHEGLVVERQLDRDQGQLFVGQGGRRRDLPAAEVVKQQGQLEQVVDEDDGQEEHVQAEQEGDQGRVPGQWSERSARGRPAPAEQRGSGPARRIEPGTVPKRRTPVNGGDAGVRSRAG